MRERCPRTYFCAQPHSHVMAQKREKEPLEPGGEDGESREVGPGGSAAELAGRPPRTRTVIHRPGWRADDEETAAAAEP